VSACPLALSCSLALLSPPIHQASEFFAGYLLEQSLSIDNLFVFVLLFGYFKVPKAYEARVLEYGILGAAVLRAVFIVLGATVIERFRPILLLFAAFLIYSSYKVLFASDSDEDGPPNMDNNFVVSLVRRLLPVGPSYDGDRFFTRLPDGTRVATPLLVVLVCVELSDLIFAVDSIPAVFGVTSDPFIVYSSNMFAIASLRALFALVVSAMTELRYLDKAVALVLGFIGTKMVADLGGAHIPTSVSLFVVLASLSGGVGLSLAFPVDKGDKALAASGESSDVDQAAGEGAAPTTPMPAPQTAATHESAED
jgi:TerC family integral membrane protein